MAKRALKNKNTEIHVSLNKAEVKCGKIGGTESAKGGIYIKYRIKSVLEEFEVVRGERKSQNNIKARALCVK